MFRLNRSLKDEDTTVSSRLGTDAENGQRSETGPIPGLRRRAYSGGLPRTASARGWRATFMSV